MTWQPIETAPKDGLDVLIWNGERPWLAYWHSGNEYWFIEDERCYGTAEPTHWMPLPDPPK